MRPSRDEIYMDIAQTMAMRSTCLRGQVGCAIVLDNRFVSCGYNGAPPGQPHCTPETCRMGADKSGCARSIHAEANAIAFAARQGISTRGGTMYCTHSPCYDCAKLLGSAGIVKVKYHKLYRLTAGLELLRDMGIDCECIPG